MEKEDKDFVIKLMNTIIMGNVTENFSQSTPESKAAIIFSLVSAHRLINDPLYLDLAENLIDSFFSQIKNNAKIENIAEYENSQVRSAFFGSAILYLYDFSRDNKYLDYAKMEMDYLISHERKRTKEQGHLSYFKNSSQLFAESSYLVYTFLVKISSIINDRLLMSKALNEYLALIHQLRDDQTGLYNSIFKKRLFKFGIESKPYHSLISNAYVLASLAEICNILKGQVGVNDFTQKEKILERYAVNLTETLLKCQDKGKNLFPYELFVQTDKPNDVQILNLKFDLADSILIFNAITRLIRMDILPTNYLDIVKKNYQELKSILNSAENFYENEIYHLDSDLKYNYCADDVKYLSICNFLFLLISLEKATK